MRDAEAGSRGKGEADSSQAMSLGPGSLKNWNGAFKDRLTWYRVHWLTKIYKLSNTINKSLSLVHLMVTGGCPWLTELFCWPPKPLMYPNSFPVACCLPGQWFPKCGPHTNSISISLGILLEMPLLRPLSGSTGSGTFGGGISHLYFNKPSGQFWHTLKSENHWSRTILLSASSQKRQRESMEEAPVDGKPWPQ